MSERIWTIALQSSVLLASAGVITFLLRRQSAALRHYVWTLALGFALLLPLWPEAATVVPLIVVGEVPTRIVVRPGGVAEGGVDWFELARWVWMVGVALLLLVEVLAQLRAAWLRRRAVDVDGGYALSAAVSVPMVCGLFAPKVLLPVEAEGWPQERIAVVLAHERMHVLRRDLWWRLLGRIACAFYWLNPLVWLAMRAQQRECEQACDDGVVASGVAAADYADHLVTIARNLNRDSILEGGLLMAQRTTLEARLLALLNPFTLHRPVSRGTLVLTFVLSMALLAPVVGMRLIAQSTAGGVRGVVKDAGGAPVADAKVTVRFLKPGTNGRVELVRTNAEGKFVIPNLPEDEYGLIVEKSRFAVLANMMIRLGGAQSEPVVFTLNAGRLNEFVPAGGGTTSMPIPPPPPPPPPPWQPVMVNAARIKIGGDAQASKLVNKVTPLYPADCKAERVEGIVLLDAVIGKEGSVMSLNPVNQLVDLRLRDAALNAVRLWQYKPTLLNGNPVEVTTQIEVNFTLLP